MRESKTVSAVEKLEQALKVLDEGARTYQIVGNQDLFNNVRRLISEAIKELKS